MSAARQLRKSPQSQLYTSFDKLNGAHPWMKVQPKGYIPYRVRELQTGEVAYFNYVLAKEMGLLPADHAHTMNATLKSTILDTFSIQIINEYDILRKKEFDPKTIKPNDYMATRYLQLQHNSRQGKTSGDGRGIWNGVISHRGKTWDISSRGTGVTCLAPGSVEANKPLRTGGGQFGYGCGLAEIDELYGSAILAEIMYLQGIHTERVLAIIDLGRGYGIGVRAAPNLLRPAHFFPYLKQNRWSELKSGFDFFIDRQLQNHKWKATSKSENKYDMALRETSASFAKFTAQLDIDYIFAWLDWDGDNVLADAGIIDYGSVRQFGIRHDQYRYDDVERFSTNLNEQRHKARQLIQTMAQMSDYIQTKNKKPLASFAKHPSVLNFNKEFARQRAHRLLYRIGFNEEQREKILQRPQLFEKFDREFSYFEKAKISGRMQNVADGVNHPALFNLRAALRELPAYLAKNGLDSRIPEDTFFKTILSGFAKNKDMKVRSKHKKHIQNFQNLYAELLKASQEKNLKSFCERSERLNREDRITGNALIQIVNELIKETKKGLPHEDLQNMIDQLVFNHLGLPEVQASRHFKTGPRKIARPELYNKMLNLIADHKEDI